jgi:DNA-binding beta-propeller fold protein YncE
MVLVVYSSVWSLTIDPQQENVYFSDYNNNRIRKVNLLTNIITTFADCCNYIYNGENILVSNVNMNHPMGIRFDTVGNLYFIDDFFYNHN